MFNSERLKQLRLKHGLSQQVMSERLKITQSSYSKYETNKADLNLLLLQKLNEEFGVDPNEFINTETSRNVYFENGSVVNGNGVVNTDNYYAIPKEMLQEIFEVQKMILGLLKENKKV